MLHHRHTLAVFAFASLFASLLAANPDVIFTDTAEHNGCYLKHELRNAKVKFILSHDVPGVSLPDEFFSVSKLIDFIEDGNYVFANQAMKLEFVRMLRMSIESHFSLHEFTTELIKFLDAFKKTMNGEGDADGCSTRGSANSSMGGFLILVYLCVRLGRLRLGLLNSK